MIKIFSKTRVSLSYKLGLLVTFSTFLIVVSLGLFFYSEGNKNTEKQMNDYLTTVTGLTESQIFLFFEKNKIQISDWSSDGHIRIEFEEILKNSADKGKSQERINLLADYIKKNKHSFGPRVYITDIFDLNGAVVVSTAPDRLGYTAKSEELDNDYGFSKSKSAAFGDANAVSPINEAGEAGHPVLRAVFWHVSVPIISQNTGKTIGVMVNHILSDEIDDILKGGWQKKYEAETNNGSSETLSSSDIYLINKDKLMITPSKFAPDGVFRQKVYTLPVNPCLGKGKIFSGSYSNYRGILVQGVLLCLSDNETTLVAEIDKSEFFAHSAKEAKKIVFAGVFLWVITLSTGLFFSQLLLRNIKQLSLTAGKISAGDFSVRADVKSKDEIGDLAVTFNTMLDSVDKYRQEIEKANADIMEKDGKIGEKMAEMERFQKLTINRELKMIELKKEIEDLKKKPVVEATESKEEK